MVILVNGILDVFNQYKNLISNVSIDVFRKSFPNASSLGAHVRHVLDRANCVVVGFSTGVIDYDTRRRQLVLENEPSLCVNEFDRLFKEIENYDKNMQHAVTVSETISNDGLKVSFQSNYQRELLDIILHATHHLAIIKFILEKSGVAVEKDLGKNSSTVIYERS